MNARSALNLGLAATVAGLALFVAFGPDGEAPKATNPITPLVEDQIRKIRIERKGGADVVELAREDGRWWLTSPRRAPANAFRTGSALEVARLDSVARYPAADRDLAPFGLAQPQLRVLFDATTILVGDSEPVHRRRYLQVGDTLHLVDIDPQHRLTQPWTQFVSTRLLEDDQKPVRIAAPALTLARGDGGTWTLTPAVTGLGADDVQGRVDEWRHASAYEVAEASAGERGPKVRVELEGGAALEFEILAERPETRLLRRDLDLVYTLGEATGQRLLHPPAPPAKDAAAPANPS